MQRMLRNLSWALVLAAGVVLAEPPAVKSVPAVDLGRAQI